jgi:hypothetical protein
VQEKLHPDYAVSITAISPSNGRRFECVGISDGIIWNPAQWRSMCGCTGNASPASSPALATSLRTAEGVSGPLRSVTKTYGVSG